MNALAAEFGVRLREPDLETILSVPRPLRVVRFACVTALVSACSAASAPGAPGVSDRIAEQIRREPGRIVDLATLAPFQWSRVYIFEPYTSQRRAERELGFQWTYRWGAIETLDDRALLVFIDSNRVAGAIEHTIDRGDFTIAGRPGGFPRDSARFVLAAPGQIPGAAKNVLVWHP